MALRPHCLKCGSTSVVLDRDVENGCLSAYCYICGNRQYRGTDYRGFELREENMLRATCKNCKRPDMAIVAEGLCWSCSRASKQYPDLGPERSAAMSAVAEKTKNLPGPHRNKRPGSEPEKPAKQTRSKQRIHLTPPPPLSVADDPVKFIVDGVVVPRNKRGVNFKDESDFSPTIEIRFTTPEDRRIYSALQEDCRSQRRTLDQQILFMIGALVQTAKADKQIGAPLV